MKRLLPLALVLLVALPALAQDAPQPRTRPGDDNDNLRFVITVADRDPAGAIAEHAVEALLLDGERARLQTGWRIPIPTTTFNTVASGDKVPVTSFSYQDVGVEVSLHCRTVEDGRIRASGEVELSSVDQEGPGASPAQASPPVPTVGTFRYAFDVKLTNGAASTVAEVPKPGGGTMTLTIQGTIEE